MTTPIALEFVGTECLRPEICERAWRSFRSRLKGIAWPRTTLYLNIDPVPPESNGQAGKMIEAAQRVFGRVVVHQPEEANFARAVKWGWSRPKDSAFFYLQADWVLKSDVDLLSLLPLLNECDAVNLRAYGHNWGPRHLCLSPVLIKTEVARGLAGGMVDDVGPEAQLRAPSFREGGRSLAANVTVLHWPPQRDRIVLADIGRGWMKTHGLKKKDGKSFVTWEKAS